LPPNSLLKEVVKFKKRNKASKIIADILDMWPESLTISDRAKKLLKIPLGVWKNYRNKNLRFADAVFTECEYYHELLADEGVNADGFTALRLFGEAKRDDTEYIPSETLRFLYLGSINNIIDIDKTVEFLAQMKNRRSVSLDIIGDGERRGELIQKAEGAGVKVVYHGKVFDDAFKQKVMNNCDFGLNIYKENIAVGLTIKSVDYMRGGLPIINTVKGDTYSLVENEKIGYNYMGIQSLFKTIIDMDSIQLLAMRHNVQQCYDKYFTLDKFNCSLKEGIKI
jgi:glycosyltransferase involved in cell wall biosynthesis